MTLETRVEPTYTFEEFNEHTDKVTALLAADRTPDEGSFGRSVMRASEYFKSQYPDGYERTYKHGRFCLMMHYISHHLKDFDRGDYAVYGSEKVGSLVSYHLLRAIHHVYTSDDLLKRESEPTQEEIIAIAEPFRGLDHEPAPGKRNPK